MDWIDVAQDSDRWRALVNAAMNFEVYRYYPAYQGGSGLLYPAHCPLWQYKGLFISPSRISELDCATTKTDTAERSISIGRESLQVFFFVLGGLAYFQVPPLGGSREEKWRSQ